MDDSDIEGLMKILEDRELRQTSSSHGPIETTFEIKPSDFLDFAEKDLMSDYSHKDINALSNAKRALDCQLDSILIAFGLFSLAQRERWNFPKKIEIINELGVVAPRVLAKINRIRNLMEHEFARPNLDQTSDFIDITSLFFAATDKYIYNLIHYFGFQIIQDYDNGKFDFIFEGVIQLEYEKITVSLTKYVDNDAQVPKDFEIKNNDSQYIRVLAKYLNVAMKY